MATARDIVTKALRRAKVVAADQQPSSTDAAYALDALNGMMRGWATDGVDVLMQSDFALSDAFQFWVPPKALTSETIDVIDYRGTWNSALNSPALASSSGTDGYVYRVSTAGSTVLDDVSSWAVNDYAVFDGSEWMKGISSARYDDGVVAMLALTMASDFGIDPPAIVVRDAKDGWAALLSAFVKAPTNRLCDTALFDMPSNRYINR